MLMINKTHIAAYASSIHAKRFLSTVVTAVLLCCGISGSAANADRPAKPNIVLLLTDDLGWQDVKCYDIDEPSPYETPNIDALAKKGVMFWQPFAK